MVHLSNFVIFSWYTNSYEYHKYLFGKVSKVGSHILCEADY